MSKQITALIIAEKAKQMNDDFRRIFGAPFMTATKALRLQEEAIKKINKKKIWVI